MNALTRLRTVVTDRTDPLTRHAAVDGAVGGLVATVVMTVYRAPVFRALPPTAEFWARYVGGGEAEQYPAQGFVLHLLYGTVAGALFGPILEWATRRSPLGRDPTGVTLGVAYGLLLSIFGTRVLFPRLLRRGLEPDHALVFHAGHAVYGLTLGTWLTSRERRGRVYETPPSRGGARESAADRRHRATSSPTREDTDAQAM
ncbi:DUF6789 family protein [Halobium salinum]|uniref:DUF6789 family protein n=1 Tax=Halobium salinum TaxID=1364940 RepID=A0ABD5PGV1_9EURY|nr:hypothetical protein [Halobium salinum]